MRLVPGGMCHGLHVLRDGTGRLHGQLSVGQVLEQVMFAARTASPARLSNVVFMGMGEPLANYADDRGSRQAAERVSRDCRRVTSPSRRWAWHRPSNDWRKKGLPLTLAVSLHAANDETRNELVPLNRRYPLERLHAACLNWIETTGRRLSFEWALIDGVNDTEAPWMNWRDYANSLGAHVNLIPLNPTPGYLGNGFERRARTRVP